MSSRIGLKTFVYVAGFERGVRPIGDWSMSMTLSRCSRPSSFRCAPGRADRLVEEARRRAVEDVVHERRLARARHARHGREDAERELHGQVLQVVLRGADDRERLPRPLAPDLRRLDAEHAREVLARQRARERRELVRRPLADDLAAVDPGAGAEVHDAVREADRLLVVLDDDDRVPEVAHRDERVDELAVVLGVEADRRLVEDVEDAHELAADLRREPDPLRLAAGERRRRAREGEVADPDVVQEPETVADLLEDLPRDLELARRGLQLREERLGVLERERRERVDRAPVHEDRERLRLQAPPLAVRARRRRHVVLHLGARVLALDLLVLRLEDRDEALEGGGPGVLALLGLPLPLDLAVARAVEDDLADVLRQLRPRRRRSRTSAPWRGARSASGASSPTRACRARSRRRGWRATRRARACRGPPSGRSPRPLHVGQAPNGELKEKRRGVISASDVPQSGQA